MDKLAAFAYQSPIRHISASLLENKINSPLEISRLENLLENEKENRLDSLSDTSASKSGLKRRSVVCQLKDGTIIKLCSTCANKNNRFIAISQSENKQERTAAKKTIDDKYTIRTRNKTFTEESSIANSTANDLSVLRVSRSRKAKKIVNDQTNTETSENNTSDFKTRYTRRRKDTNQNTENTLDLTYDDSKEGDNKVKDNYVKSRKILKTGKDAIIENELSAINDITAPIDLETVYDETSISTINHNLTDSLITTRKTRAIYKAAQSIPSEQSEIFNSTAIVEDQWIEYDSIGKITSRRNKIKNNMENFESMRGRESSDSRYKDATLTNDLLKYSGKRVKYEQKKDRETMTRSTKNRTKNGQGKTSKINKNSSNEATAMQELNSTEEISMTKEYPLRNRKRINVKTQKFDLVNVKAKPQNSISNKKSIFNMVSSQSSMINRTANRSVKTKGKSTNASFKKANTRSRKAEMSSKSSHLASSPSHESDSSPCDCYNCVNQLDSPCKCYNCTTRLDSSYEYDYTHYWQASPDGSDSSLVSEASDDNSRSSSTTCCRRHSRRRHRAKKRFNLRDLSK